MIKIRIPDDETVLYVMKKRKLFVVLLLIFCPSWLYLFSLFAIPTFQSLFMGQLILDASSNYILTIEMMVTTVPMATILPICFLMRKLVVTDKKIYIRKAFGKQLCLDLNDIAAFQYSKSSNSTNVFNFYFRNGKQFILSYVIMNKKSANQLVTILEQKFPTKISHKKAETEFTLAGKEDFVTVGHHNHKMIAIICIPFVTAFLMLSLYFGGFNQSGTPQSIKIVGTVQKKIYSYNTRYNTTSYALRISSENNSKYMITVSANLYDWYDEKDRIIITAKKGKLGIVYEERFYK